MARTNNESNPFRFDRKHEKGQKFQNYCLRQGHRHPIPCITNSTNWSVWWSLGPKFTLIDSTTQRNATPRKAKQAHTPTSFVASLSSPSQQLPTQRHLNGSLQLRRVIIRFQTRGTRMYNLEIVCGSLLVSSAGWSVAQPYLLLLCAAMQQQRIPQFTKAGGQCNKQQQQQQIDRQQEPAEIGVGCSLMIIWSRCKWTCYCGRMTVGVAWWRIGEVNF